MIEALFDEPASPAVLDRAGYALTRYPIETVRPLLYRLIDAPPSDRVLYWVTDALGSRGDGRDLEKLRSVAARSGVERRTREVAEKTAQLIEAR